MPSPSLSVFVCGLPFPQGQNMSRPRQKGFEGLLRPFLKSDLNVTEVSFAGRFPLPIHWSLVCCKGPPFGGLRMTCFLPPLSTATAPQNEIICPELRISGAYLPKTQKSRGSAGFFWATPETKSAQFFRQKLDNFCRGLPGSTIDPTMQCREACMHRA